MSLRVLFCLFFILAFSWYAYRDWFVSLCALIVLMAFTKHPDMPRGMLGIPGMNFWNLLLVNVMFAWWRARQHEGLTLDFPRPLRICLGLYLTVISISVIRMLINPTSYTVIGRPELFIDYFVNSIRFLLPALLLYDGCRDPQRIKIAMGAIVLLYFLLAVQVVRYMGFHPDFSGNELSGRAARIIQRSVGYDRVDMSMMLSGASWAAVAFANVIERKWYRWGIRGAAFVILFGQAMTGGRTGYVTWGAIGLILCVVKWRKLLPLIPLAAVMIAIFFPSVSERMFSGFGGQSGGIVVEQNASEITSGRNVVWPVVIAQIKKAPLFGYGRQGMLRTGLVDYVREVLEDSFPHPHEAYLEMMLDAGVVGLACVLPIYLLSLKWGLSLFRDRADILCESAGAMAVALLLALLLASFGAQTLYPREGVVGMWAALGVAARLWVDRAHKRENEADLEYAEATIETDEPPFGNGPRETMAGV